MNELDWQKVFGLLHIVDLAKQWPRLKPTHDAAMAELEKMQKPEEPEIPQAIPATPVVTRRLEPEGEA